MQERTVKLSAMAAKKIIQSVLPGLRMKKDETAPSVAIYRAGTCRAGGLEVKVENDWFHHDGKIHMTISDPSGAGHIDYIFNPRTLERDFDAETRMQRESAKEDRIRWVQSMGAEMAHRLVNEYERVKL